MKHFKLAFITYILPIIAVGFVACSYSNATDSKMYACNQQHALCTSALCVPQPGDPSKAICFCDVETGLNMSTSPCDKLRPSIDANGIQTIYSTLSFEQFKQGKLGMKCPSGTPWTWCLNKRCTQDPFDPQKAICVCDVKRTQEWTTLGGNCDTSTCKTGYWSGAPVEGINVGYDFLTKAMGLDESPAKWCEAGP